MTRQKQQTVEQVVDRFLRRKKRAANRGDITPRTYLGYLDTGMKLIEHFRCTINRVTPRKLEDFNNWLAENMSPSTRKVHITKARTILNSAFETGFSDRPIRYGSSFSCPSRKALARHKREKGRHYFHPEEIHQLLDHFKGTPHEAFILLAINCGFGNVDIAELQWENIYNGWVDYPRPKTEVDRRCKLWQETELALITHGTRGCEGPLFMLKEGTHYIHHNTKTGTISDRIGPKFMSALNALGMGNDSLRFYALRHTYATVACGSCDQVAVNHTMGHVDASVPAMYREYIDDARLVKVSDHVHDWLFGCS